MTVTRMIARPMIASTFFVGAVSALKNAPKLAGKASGVTDALIPAVKRFAPTVPVPEDPVTLVRINAAVQLAAAGALATGNAPRLAAATLATSLVPTTIAGHRFWEESDPDAAEEPAAALLQEPRHPRWPPARGGRHRGQAGRGLAGPARGQGRAPRGQARDAVREARGQAGGREARVTRIDSLAG